MLSPLRKQGGFSHDGYRLSAFGCWLPMRRYLGRIVDADDRRVIGQVVALFALASTLVLSAAGVIGLAWRVLALAAG